MNGSAKKRRSARPRPLTADLIGLSATVVLALAVGVATIGAGVRKNRALTEEQRGHLARLEGRNDLALALADVDLLIREHSKWLEAPVESLPARLDFEGFYGALADSAERNGVLLTSVRPDQIVSDADPEHIRMPVHIEAKASFPGFHQLLHSVMNLPGRLAKLESLTIRQADGGSGCEIEWTVTLLARGGRSRSPAGREGTDGA